MMQPNNFQDVTISFDGVEIGKLSSLEMNEVEFQIHEDIQPYTHLSRPEGSITIEGVTFNTQMMRLLLGDYKQAIKDQRHYYKYCKIYDRTKSHRIRKKALKEIMKIARRH